MAEPRFKPGDKVLVVQTYFAGTVGKIIRHCPGVFVGYDKRGIVVSASRYVFDPGRHGSTVYVNPKHVVSWCGRAGLGIRLQVGTKVIKWRELEENKHLKPTARIKKLLPGVRFKLGKCTRSILRFTLPGKIECLALDCSTRIK